MARFPVAAEAQEALRRELALLPELARELPVAVPCPAHVAEDDGRLVFVAYRALEGQPLSDTALETLAPPARTRALDELAALLDAIHAFPLERAQADGVSFEMCKGAYHPAQQKLERTFSEQLEPAERSAIAQQRDAFIRAQSSVQAPVLLHADIKPAHLLHDPLTGALTGLLDWGDASLGHGDFDLAIISAFCGPRTLNGLLGRLSREDRERVRASLPFLLTVRWLQDALYVRRRGGDADQMEVPLRRLREHLRVA